MDNLCMGVRARQSVPSGARLHYDRHATEAAADELNSGALHAEPLGDLIGRFAIPRDAFGSSSLLRRWSDAVVVPPAEYALPLRYATAHFVSGTGAFPRDLPSTMASTWVRIPRTTTRPFSLAPGAKAAALIMQSIEGRKGERSRTRLYDWTSAVLDEEIVRARRSARRQGGKPSTPTSRSPGTSPRCDPSLPADSTATSGTSTEMDARRSFSTHCCRSRSNNTLSFSPRQRPTAFRGLWARALARLLLHHMRGRCGPPCHHAMARRVPAGRVATRLSTRWTLHHVHQVRHAALPQD